MKRFLWGAASLLALTASQAMAQAAPAEVGEIIVTAQKREQSIQDTPLAISAFGSAALQDLQVISPGIAWDERMAVFDLTLPGRAPVSFVALHMTKPWFYGIIDDEIDTVEAALPRHPGPMVLAGDLNSAPWSLRLRWLRRVAHLEDPPVPIATWRVSRLSAGARRGCTWAERIPAERLT